MVRSTIRKDAEPNQFYKRIVHRKGINPVRVATARRSLTTVYKILKENREYKYAG